MKKRALLLLSSGALVAGLVSVASGCAQQKAPPTTSEGDAIQAPTYVGPPTVQVSGPIGDWLPGKIVVDVKDNLSDDEIDQLSRDAHVRLVDNSPEIKGDGNVEVADVEPGEMASVLERLRKDPRVESAEPMEIARAFWTPNDPKFTEQWHMSKVNAERGWEYACGQGVTVAVVDTGIACYDEAGFMKGTDLAGTSCVDGWNFVAKNKVAADDQGHGTHVAGTIAQTTNNGVGVAGLSHCAKLMPVKVLSKQGWGTMADVAEGIRWAADHGAQVINLSLGAPSKAKVVEAAVNHAMSKGVVVVAAAGNSGRSVGYPAGYPGVIAVSATDKNDNIAWFSSRGPEVVIGAPGVAITQQTICEAGKNKCEIFGVFNGTSMASPHVAGAAALLVGQGITDPAAVQATLTSTAKPKEEKNLFGAGILDAGAAVARTHWVHFGVRLAALVGLFGLVFWQIKKNRGTVEKGMGKWVGAALAGLGALPFLPLLGVPARLGGARIFAELAMRPFGEWTVLLSPGLHKWLPLASALPAFALTTLFFNNKLLRPLVGGVAVGTAALCVQMGLSGETWFALGSVGLRVWCAVNAVACLWIARMTLDAKRS